MGRLVHDKNGVGRFAGSTTGVHFVLSVEKECRKSLNLTGGFPESCFRLFLTQLCSSQHEKPFATTLYHRGGIFGCFTDSLPYYHEQANLFVKEWEAFCPVLVPMQLMTDINSLFEVLHDPLCANDVNYATVLTLLMILCINETCSDTRKPTSEPKSNYDRYSPVASSLIDEVATRGDLKSLQAIILFAFYNQLNGHCLAMTRANGIITSLAQSLGLHRHARRFKMKPGEIELRKRLWWWVYVFDKITSLHHGLPSQINDLDVDNDMPLDCNLTDLDVVELAHPLPGEKTPVFEFIQYVHLGKILSRIREMLYTTTKRRNGAAKINELDLDLRMWNQNLKSNGIHFDIGSVSARVSSENSPQVMEKTTLWLQLLANVAIILIHRPGLSFDDSTVEFSKCLQVMDMILRGVSILQRDSVDRPLDQLQRAQAGQISVGVEPEPGQGILTETPGIFDQHSTCDTNALADLNYVTATDWMYGVPGPFMGFMDFDGSENLGRLPRSP
ncbi:hypothetical protein N7466_007519 [Penicillium verhagenii]|uniref:uncharacterized protein n=1 Tax=Penicillium verhagenii TaxID=1562060 RepID=UPI002545BAA4|nr:uncharacterized protein N7466_007519 [Penicillium verhagenii]KAJ5928563.1 hypothetical protein N7466_007519 [Penicillium verhagenii]